MNNKWISVEERPLFTTDKNGNWICTEDGDREFIAAIPYTDKNKPNKELWWIRHCVIEDEVGLCVVGDDDNEKSGWELEHITHWQPLPPPPTEPNEMIKESKELSIDEELVMQFGEILAKFNRTISPVSHVKDGYTYSKDCASIAQQHTNVKLSELEKLISSLEKYKEGESLRQEISKLKEKIN